MLDCGNGGAPVFRPVNCSRTAALALAAARIRAFISKDAQAGDDAPARNLSTKSTLCVQNSHLRRKKLDCGFLIAEACWAVKHLDRT